MYFVHRYTTELAYGGPEEGGWWYNHQEPDHEWQAFPFDIEEDAHQFARSRNLAERRRQDGMTYGYTSVLAHRDAPFYVYDVSESGFANEWTGRPHYE